ncbi:hypothetical protein STEG23_010583 [Scotinomys teguina]
MQPGRTTNTGGGTMEVKAAAPRCQLLLILLMSVVMLLPGTNGSLLLVQRTVTRTIVLQETICKDITFAFSDLCDSAEIPPKVKTLKEDWNDETDVKNIDFIFRGSGFKS